MVRRQHGNSQEHITKHIFVTGGVVSSLGKGLTASSLGRLLRSRGIHVLQQKLDPYINVDPGTMNPFQHGEVYVTEDGAETDLDIGHYERFLDVFLSQKANVTTGQIYQEVLRKERAGEYLGQCVQVIPHITNEIKSRMRAQASDDVDVIITEIGGTVGDIESQPFLEAAREVRRDLGAENCMFVHVSLVPYISAAHELKTKPTQHSVMMLRQLGISPDALVLRSDRPLNKSIKDKISLMCDVDEEGVVNCVDAPSIYDVPRILFDEGLDAYVVRELGLPFHDVDWDEWADLLERVHHPKHEVNVEYIPSGIDIISLVVESKKVSKCLYAMLGELQKEVQPNKITVTEHIAIVAAVGRKMAYRPGVSGKIFAKLGENGVNIRMITQGPEELNIIVGVEEKDFAQAIRVLYDSFVKEHI